VSRADRLLIAALACFALAATPVALAIGGSQATDGGTVSIEGPKGTSLRPLTEDAVVLIDGAQGSLTVETLGGAVCVSDAACPDHSCIRTGWVRTPGSAIVCLPNGVTVRIGGARDDGLDAVVR